MSQLGDYNLANQSGSNFRSELNDILGDIKSMNSGSSVPTNPVEGELWYDTNTNRVAIYNGTAFVNLWDTDSSTWIGTITIPNNSVTPEKMTGGTPATGQVLVATGATTVDWQTAPGFASGTRMIFQQSSAPTGWTIINDTTVQSNGGLRIITSGTVSVGGTADWTSPTHSLIGGSHTLTISQVPAHSHKVAGSEGGGGIDYGENFSANNFGPVSSGRTGQADTSSQGGGGSHTHPVSGSITEIKYTDVIVASKD